MADIRRRSGDNGNNRPGIGSTPNGVPLVDIVTPNARGLSHNKYDQFNVGKPGLILNNFNGEVGTSRLGGVTPGNANLKNSGPASVILNEVTSGNRSQLLGPTEVFGGRADVVIANPNGITCDGCGFINTPRATLSTGTPDVGADGRLNGLTVRGGDVTIGAKGANFSAGHGAVDLFDIVSRSVRIYGPLYAKDLRLTAGRNKFAYDTGEATPLEATSGTPEFAIDGSALGAMQAGRIKIVVTEKGAGVRMRGDMAANVGELSLSADGKISIGNASGASGVNINSKARIEARKVTSKKKFVAKAQKGIVLETVAADGNVEIAGGAGLLSVSGDVTSLGAVVLSSAGNLSLGSLEAGGPVSARSSAGNIAVWGIAKAAGDVTLDAASGSISAGSLVSFRNLSLQAGLDIGIANDILAQGNVTARARSIRSNAIASGVDIDASAARSDGETVLGDAGDLKLTASAGIEAATLLSAGNLSVSASSLKSDTVTSHRSIGISGDVDVSGQVLGAGDVLIEGRSIAADTVASGVLLHSAGGDGDIVLGTAGALTLDAKGGSVDVRSLSSAGRLVVEAESVEAASVTAQGSVALSGDLTVSGQVLGGGDIVASGRRIAVKALVSGVDFARTTAGAPVVLRDRGDITINAASGSVEADMLLSAGSLKATAAALTADSITSHEDLDIAGTVAVSGTVLGARNVSIDGGAISADSIATKSGDLALIARNGAVDVDALESAGQITVDASRLEARTVTGRGDVRIDGNVTIAEQLIAERNITLAGRDLSIETLIAGLDFDRTAASGGKAVLAGEGGITIDAASGSLRMATLLSAADVSATVGKLDASNVSGHGNISIADDVNVGGQILGARDVAISGNALRAGAIASGVDFAATAAAGGSLVLGPEGDLRLSARGGTVAADILTSAGHLGVDASRLDSQSIEGHGDIRIAGNTTVRGRLLGAGDIDIAGQSLSIETLVAGVAFDGGDNRCSRLQDWAKVHREKPGG
ncbi:Hemolysin (plasmid) [Sinorhizobium sojae CCBAU 05684]|uniref:Hemolysin n=1 Tax=Sinorhizobium sojae CCBAU 05684 TaxID=716928 RepID=A0A249PLQ7_9HYPH|nr:filamentous hemagglutinin N-terminal domain-containing protein [Sinorhizobium sojae]ASY66249.1 Hemolysin [Sinorhizobium sojae CCBAU 05684]